MDTLGGPVRLRKIERDAYARLASFSAGDSRQYERDINEVVRLVTAGEGQANVLVMEDSAGDVIGAAAFDRRALITQAEETDAAYIGFLAVSSAARGSRSADGERVGAALLRGVIVEIEKDWRGLMPPIWALIHRENINAQSLFQQYGFAVVPMDGEYWLFFRPPDLPLPERKL